MDKNATATFTPDEIIIKLVEKEVMIKRENALWQEALLFIKGNAKGNAKGNGKDEGRKSWKGDECDENQGDRKSQLTCFYCHHKEHKNWDCPNRKRGDPPVMKEITETAAKVKNDTITARHSVEMTTTIEYY